MFHYNRCNTELPVEILQSLPSSLRDKYKALNEESIVCKKGKNCKMTVKLKFMVGGGSSSLTAITEIQGNRN